MTLGGVATEADVVLVSDLHLGAHARDDGHWHQEAFAALLLEVDAAQRQRRRPWRLVVLGDMIDFSVAGEPALARNLLELEGRVRGVLGHVREVAPAAHEALVRILELGVPVHLVAGNHDYELAHPRVQELVADWLAAASGRSGRLTFHPWILMLPGLLYAEHGSQHHDINRVPSLLARVDALARGSAPTAAAVLGRTGRLLDRRGNLPLSLRRAVSAASASAAVLACALADRPPQRAAYARRTLEDHAAGIGLPGDVLARLDSASPVRLGAVASRLVRKLATRRAISRYGSDYLDEAVGRVHHILSVAGVAPSNYIFGHSHVPSRRFLNGADDDGPVYLNTGTWSPMVRGLELQRHGRRRPAWVHIDGVTGSARLRRWHVDELAD